MMDTDFERKLANPLLNSRVDIATEAIRKSIDNMTDKALSYLYSLVVIIKTGGERESCDAMLMIERMIGTLTTDEFKLLDEQVTDSFNCRFGPVSGWL